MKAFLDGRDRGGTEPAPRTVRVEHPLNAETTCELTIARGASATSGLRTRTWRTANGYAHHLIDPASGQPAWTGVIQATALADTALLTKVLTYHVVPGLVLKAEVPVGPAITTVQGESFTVSAALAITDRRARVSNIVATDVLTGNGVIHVVDKVILPAP